MATSPNKKVKSAMEDATEVSQPIKVVVKSNHNGVVVEEEEVPQIRVNELEKGTVDQRVVQMRVSFPSLPFFVSSIHRR